MIVPERIITSASSSSSALNHHIPLSMYGTFRPPTPFQTLVKPVIFTAVASVGAFATAAYIWERHQVTLLKRIQAWRARAKQDRPSAGEFVQIQAEIMQERWSRFLERLRWIQNLELPVEVQKAIGMIRQRWRELTPAERTIWGIIGLNSIIFAAWQVPRLAPFMEKWFMHSPNSGRSITLLTSVFSHQHLWHFGLNMFALYSFGQSLHDHMRREQFLAFYLTAGMTASLASHLFTVASTPWLAMVPSLGASGALFACVSSTAFMHPDTSVFLIFLPFFPIKIPFALGAMMGLDLVGIIRGWRTFDHYAHLAGASFGLAYMYGGETHIWNRCQQWAIDFNKDSDKFTRLASRPSAPTIFSNEPSSQQETKESPWDKAKSCNAATTGDAAFQSAQDAQAQGKEPQLKVRRTHCATVAIKYLLDSSKRSYSDSESEDEAEENPEEDREETQMHLSESRISSAHNQWLARLRHFSNGMLQGEDDVHGYQPRNQTLSENAILKPVQVLAKQPKTVCFGIKARRELRALQAAQGHRHVITLLGWTDHPVKYDIRPPSSPKAAATEAETGRDRDLKDIEQAPALLGTPLPLSTDPVCPPPLLSSYGSENPQSNEGSTLPRGSPSALFSLPSGFERDRNRFSDDEADQYFGGESDIEDDDDYHLGACVETSKHPPSVASTITMIDQEDLQQHYRTQPRIGGLLLPYMPLTLRDLIQSGWSKDRPKLVRTCMLQVLEGLDWIHEEAQLIHRDISAGNILVSTRGWMNWTMLNTEEEKDQENSSGMAHGNNDDDQKVFCVLSDFGCAVKDRHLDQSSAHTIGSGQNGAALENTDHITKERDLYTFEVGTRNYRAPELLFSSQTYGKSVDIWSAGVLFAELFLGRPLFDADTDIGLICAIVKVLGTPTVDNWPEFPEMPDYGKLNFQARVVTPLSTLLLGSQGQTFASEEETTENQPLTFPPTRATKPIVDIISKLVLYSGKQRLSAREALDALRTVESQTTQASAASTTSMSMENETQEEGMDTDVDDDRVDITAIKDILEEMRRREREANEDEYGEGFGFGFGFERGPSDSDDQDDDSEDTWQAEETGMMARYRPSKHRRPFVSRTEWVSDDEF
ncbi:hypothetical protein BGW41_004728 [Actinomortierella wolfii]|nr:hypothetical protein BGW41_004728 [Actinomortierella wolfii]